MGSKVETQVQVQQGENIAGHARVSFMLSLAGVAVILMVHSTLLSQRTLKQNIKSMLLQCEPTLAGCWLTR